MHLLAALTLTAHLNACRHSTLSAEVAARTVVGEHAAHHVIDTAGLLGLDPLAANELDTALGAALLLVDSDWLLTLPRPGRLFPLTGPPDFNARAVAAGAAVVPLAGGPAWIPQAVGPAIQWSIVEARPPRPVASAPEADRHLREIVLSAGRRLADLPLGNLDRPEHEDPPPLPGCYGKRAQQTMTRSWHLVRAAEAALADDGETLHLHAIQARRAALAELRDASEEALCAAVSWTGAQRES